MARVNVFLRGWNSSRDVSIGGRRANDRGGFLINTDTADGEIDMQVTASVSGNTCAKDRRKYGDNRVAHFHVTLPRKSPNCKVVIDTMTSGIRSLLSIGAALCTIKALGHEAKGEVDTAENIMNHVTEIVDMLKGRFDELPDVLLPGDVDMKYALACVDLVERLKQNDASKN